MRLLHGFGQHGDQILMLSSGFGAGASPRIFIARTIQTGQGGICGCMARLFRGYTGRAELLGTVQRHGSHRLLLLCRSIVQFLLYSFMHLRVDI